MFKKKLVLSTQKDLDLDFMSRLSCLFIESCSNNEHDLYVDTYKYVVANLRNYPPQYFHNLDEITQILTSITLLYD